MPGLTHSQMHRLQLFRDFSVPPAVACAHVGCSEQEAVSFYEDLRRIEELFAEGIALLERKIRELEARGE